jgi:fatty-acyl-CoA synthase
LERFATGDHIALWAANCPDWVLIELGAAFAGIVLVPVNPAFLGRELDHVLRKSAARGIIVQDVYRGRNLVAVVEEIAGTLPELDAIVPLSTWKDFLGAATGEGSPADCPSERHGTDSVYVRHHRHAKGRLPDA